MKKIDLNADLGEGFPFDEQLLQYVSSCNIACGGHTGDDHSMKTTLLLAKKNGVNIGAHPSYPDRDNFGRKAVDINESDLLTSLLNQTNHLINLAKEVEANVSYIKPHGALYNKAMQDKPAAQIILRLIAHYNGQLGLMGMPNSLLETMCKDKGVTFIREGFADRRYTKEGLLIPRSKNNAVIHDQNDVWQQVHQMVNHQKVADENDDLISMELDSICFHGDTPEALQQLQLVYQKLSEQHVSIKAFD
ncbi:5-oxoprolinase subunit PxpA [Flammeovirga pacifica]|uniref:Lactam utilization protein LamB n=1 Tax=Flammeovirga pacifica TaxID=915059 RepID=A0A1S1Z5H1_FLAPC|nr:5-oxoprolinase subunit PxpA [Flammeovirga pacifica]OHX68544.1 hypothetical protein NH26_11840 [Flammeovirga pacifica]